MELRSQGATVYQFEGGEPFMPTPEPVKEAMKRALDENKTRYAPSSGNSGVAIGYRRQTANQKSNSWAGVGRDRP